MSERQRSDVVLEQSDTKVLDLDLGKDALHTTVQAREEVEDDDVAGLEDVMSVRRLQATRDVLHDVPADDRVQAAVLLGGEYGGAGAAVGRAQERGAVTELGLDDVGSAADLDAPIRLGVAVECRVLLGVVLDDRTCVK